MAVADGDVVRVTVRNSFWGTDPCYNVFYMKNITGSELSNAQALGDFSDIMNGLYDNLDALMSINFDFDDILVHNVTQNSPVGEISMSSLTSGSESTTDMLPQQSAALVSFPTETLKVLGRKYLGGFTELSSTDGGGLSSGLLTALGNFATGLLSTLSGPYGDWTAGTWSTVLETFIPYLSARVDDVFQTQRRRTFGN